MLLWAVPALAAGRPVLVCFGDSITAGYGLPAGQAYPAALQRKLDRSGYRYEVNNQGTSGATSKDAVANLRTVLQLHPAVVIVEFGGNDGLRGVPPDQTRRNLTPPSPPSKTRISRCCWPASPFRPTMAPTTSRHS